MRTTIPTLLALPVVACHLVLGCGGVDEAEEGGAPASRHGLASSELTPLADKLIDVSLAALRSQPLPQTDIPIGPFLPGQMLVEQDLSSPIPAASLTVVAFIMEVDVVLRADAGYPPGGLFGGVGGGDGSLDVLYLLDRNGLRLGDLSVRSARTPRPLAPPVSGVGAASTKLLSALRDGSATRLVVHDADRVALGSDELYQEIVEDRPDLATLERAKTLVQASPTPLGYGVDDDAGAIVRGPDGSIWILALDLEQDSAGGVMLGTTPLVRVRRFGGRF